MKHFIITIKTSYSIEDYLISVQEGESIEEATEKALSDIAFCDDWEIIGEREVEKDYVKSVEAAKKAYLELTGDNVDEVFTSGKYTPLEDIMPEVSRIKAMLKYNGIQSTSVYFRMTDEELLIDEDSGLTQEEIKLQKEGKVTYFDDIYEYVQEKSKFEKWIREMGYEVIVCLRTINGRIAVVVK